ncbi:hypothetical protein CCR75_000157 [Bremia lactucae]|uniref:Ubiquitin-like protease family profile domain-containing protein n=1 Tax=Bremia lactucae TaxID=4779 RepID=A0A976FPA1_BRELC|nr:hypothetical protein CCR75_000157 [Bremia lactucae]
MEERRTKRFGAARKRTARMREQLNLNDFDMESSHYGNTREFDAVVINHSDPQNLRYSSDWEDNRYQFDFGHDSSPYRQQVSPQAPPKYKSCKPKASGQIVSAPGSSFVQPSSSPPAASVTDEVLSKNFNPPKNQHEFLEKLTKANTGFNRGPGTSQVSSYSKLSFSLEKGSAPVPERNNIGPHLGINGWKERKLQPVVVKPRTLELTNKKQTTNARKLLNAVSSQYSLRDRKKSNLLTSIAPISVNMAKLGKRKLTSEGSAAKPIALDSDSEAEEHSNSISHSNINGDNNVSNPSRAEKETVDNTISQALARLATCDVAIGYFQCIVDVIVARDRLCLWNLRGKYQPWPLKEYYCFHLSTLFDVREFNGSKGAENATDRMGQLLSESSFLALKVPFFDDDDSTVVKKFYDPASSDNRKNHMVIRVLNKAIGKDWRLIQAVIRTHTSVQLIEEREQAKEYLQTFVEDPSCYKSSQASVDIKTPMESEEDKLDGSATVLTYPLPPCTSDIVTIIRRDVARLKPRRYLNDNIIDYYFNGMSLILYNRRMMLDRFRDNELVQKKVLFLSSHFYSRLRAGKGLTTRERMVAGYNNVSTWLARSQIFHRSLIFIPINKDLHWSLAVILNPCLAGLNVIKEDAFSCIAVLDPLGSYHRKAAIIRNLRTFLRMQWENSQDCLEDGNTGESIEYGVERVLTVDVNVPHQENSYDCGVFVLKFAEVILLNCLKLNLLAKNDGVIGKDITDGNLIALITASAFCAKDITDTRKQIQQYIETDASDFQVRRNVERKRFKGVE